MIELNHLVAGTLLTVSVDPEELAKFEEMCSRSSDRELWEMAEKGLRATGHSHVENTLNTVRGGREGFIDLLVGMFCLGYLD